jgi:hypothetical protein
LLSLLEDVIVTNFSVCSYKINLFHVLIFSFFLTHRIGRKWVRLDVQSLYLLRWRSD